jgi:hypothetical protein
MIQHAEHVYDQKCNAFSDIADDLEKPASVTTEEHLTPGSDGLHQTPS